MALTKQIGNVSKTVLTNTAHMNMHTEIDARITAVTPAKLKLEALAPLYRQAIDTEGTCVNRIMKSTETVKMVDKDKERDRVFIFINSQVNSFANCPDKEMQAAALVLQAMFNAYAKAYNQSFSEETAAIDGLLRDMKDETRKAAAEKLHLSAYFTQLETLNDEYKALDAARIDEYTNRVKIDTLSARKETDNILAEIIQRINALAVLEPTDDILSFIDTVNQIFKKYKDLIAAKGGPGSTSTPEPAPEPAPEPTPDPEPEPTPDPGDRPEIE